MSNLRGSALRSALLLALSPALADAATFTVTSAADSGAGSLRAAITAANANADADTINFSIGSGFVNIALQTPLPIVTQRLKIEGFTQPPGIGGIPRIRLVGAQMSSSGQGLRLNAPNCTTGLCVVRGLQIGQFPLEGILVESGQWAIRGNYIGTDGSVARGNARNGISVEADQVVVGGAGVGEGNLISGNGYAGIGLYGNGIIVEGNRIGTDLFGSAAIGNIGQGVRVFSSDNRIGGFTAAAGNLISGNGLEGIAIESEAEDSLVVSNRVGTNFAGEAALGNGRSGIATSGPRSVIGLVGSGNLVSSNGYEGILVAGTGSSLQANRIGTDVTGNSALPNQSGGVRILQANDVDIGGVTPGDGNLVSGNGLGQILVDSEASDVRVLGNTLGTNLAGTQALGNGAGGMTLSGSNLQIGAAGAGNLISGNSGGGIAITGSPSDIRIQGNRIGTRGDGLAALGNGSIGIRAIAGENLRIGGSIAGQGNVISGNALAQITLETDTSNVHVLGNKIGTDANGNVALGSGAGGIDLSGTNLQIGAPGAGNLISGNESGGIGISGAQAQDIRIQGNRIGTRADGLAALGNGSYGIRAIQGRDVLIGGTAAGQGNLVSGNERGVSVEDGMIDTVVQGNIIGLDATQTAKLGNGEWSGLDVSGPGTLVGGSVAGAGNVIAGHDDHGLVLYGTTEPGPIVQGNFLGTNASGAAGLGNRFAGVQMYLGDNALIGGTEPGQGNEIAYNGFNGIYVRWGTRNRFIGNRIHDNALLGIEVSPQGPTPNDPLDADGGPNFGQNHPIIRSALAQGGTVTIQGELASEPSTSYLVEFNHSMQCDPSGLGQGEEPIGYTNVVTDANGRAEFTVSLPLASNQGVLTAIATSPDDASSEFSPCHGLAGPNPGQFQLWRESFIAYEGIPFVEIGIVRSLGNQGSASVQFDTIDESATAPADYDTRSLRVNFADGETYKTVKVPIVVDNQAEGQQQFQVKLSAPLGGAALGARSQVPAIIIDVGPDFPLFGIDDQIADAPPSGTATMTFNVLLSPSDVAQTISFTTVDGTAVAGQDYVATSGALQFPASTQTQTQTVAVAILPNQFGEEDESFLVDVSASGDIAVFGGYGTGVIRAVPNDRLFRDGFED